MRKSLILLITIGIIFSLGITILSTPIYASAPKAYFYLDKGQSIFAEREGTNWTFPTVTGVKEGYNFIGWATDNDITFYKAGDKFNSTITKDLEFYALWQPIVEQQKGNVSGMTLTEGEKIALYIGIFAMLILILFAFNWFVIKKKTIKDLTDVFRRKKN